MSTLSELKHSVELKLSRAGQQSQALSSSISSWGTQNPIDADCTLLDNRCGFRLLLKEFQNPPPLDEWGLALGECVHNLRSMLDNLAFALARVRQDPPQRPNQIAFPIYEDKTKFQQKGRQNIDQLPTPAADLIEKLQPFQRDGSAALGTPNRDALVLLQALNNTDKHRVPTLVLIAPNEITHEVGVAFYSDEDASANVPPDTTVWAGPLSPGAVLLEWRTTKPIAKVTGGISAKATVAIQRNEVALPVGATLQALHQYAALVAAQFDQFFQ
jgi:hypothetical protein